jgi:ribosome-binding protein aMBF1 (putative translation factor)
MDRRTTTVRCLHCRKSAQADGRRGLCRRCFADPAVRSHFPRRKSGVKSLLESDLESLTPRPSAHESGSPEDLAEKGERARLRQAMFGSADGKIDECYQLATLTLPRRIAFLRRRKRWSVRELAKKSELSPAAVSRIESGKRDPGVESIRRLAVALGETLIRVLAGL